jgi:hypothetical protein
MHFRTLNSADLLFYNENNPRFNYKPKRFARRNVRFACDDYSMDFRNIMY